MGEKIDRATNFKIVLKMLDLTIQIGIINTKIYGQLCKSLDYILNQKFRKDN